MLRFVIALFILHGTLAFAQTQKHKYFTVYTDTNRIQFSQCSSNHRVILTSLRNQLDLEIARLAVGIDYEESSKAPKIRLDAYYNLLLELTIKRMVYDEMILQLNKIDMSKYSEKRSLPRKVFNTDAIQINIKDKVGKTLESALSKYRRNELNNHIINTIALKVVTNTSTAIAQRVLLSVGNSLVANISGAALKGALISIGSEALMGAARGSLLTLLTMPLMGNRLPPEKDWMKILRKYPELIINPEWMTKAGSQDDPWLTHCFTFLRETDDLEEILVKNINKEESHFISRVTSISKLEELKPLPKNDNKFKFEPPTVAIDNTYVKKPVVILNIVPFWAMKK